MMLTVNDIRRRIECAEIVDDRNRGSLQFLSEVPEFEREGNWVMTSAEKPKSHIAEKELRTTATNQLIVGQENS